MVLADSVKKVMLACVFLLARMVVTAQPTMEQLYRPHDTSIKFSYDNITQTIDLSGNWDIDGDGKKDSLFLMGNGGAHLYFHPRLVLTRERKSREFDWIELDLPVLDSASDLNSSNSAHRLLVQFVVHDLDGDSRPDVYFNFDGRYATVPVIWRKRGVTSHKVVLRWSGGRFCIVNYKE